MPPLPLSRYSYTQGLKDADGNLFLTDPEPFVYRVETDNRYHTVVIGDTLHGLAERFFDGFPEPARLWWIIADYQPEAIFDPTIELQPGRVLVIPSVRVVQEQIFTESRRAVTS